MRASFSITCARVAYVQWEWSPSLLYFICRLHSTWNSDWECFPYFGLSFNEILNKITYIYIYTYPISDNSLFDRVLKPTRTFAQTVHGWLTKQEGSFTRSCTRANGDVMAMNAYLARHAAHLWWTVQFLLSGVVKGRGRGLMTQWRLGSDYNDRLLYVISV